MTKNAFGKKKRFLPKHQGYNNSVNQSKGVLMKHTTRQSVGVKPLHMSEQEARKKGMRTAATMLEGLLWAAFAVIIIAMGYGIYNKISGNAKTDKEFRKVQSVHGAIERSANFNNGIYPASASARLDAIPVLANSLGGANGPGIKDVAAWTYSCSAGADTTITLTTSNYNNTVIRDQLVTQVNKALAPWTAVASGNRVVMSLSNVTCGN